MSHPIHQAVAVIVWWCEVKRRRQQQVYGVRVFANTALQVMMAE